MPSLAEVVAMFLDHRECKGCSVRSVERYRRELHDWLSWRRRRRLSDDVADVNVAEFRSYLSYLHKDHVVERGSRIGQKGLGAWTIAGIDKTLRSLLRFATDEHHFSADALNDILRRVPSVTVIAQPRPIYSIDHIQQLLLACNEIDDELSARNHAMVLLFLDSGMRIAELCGLEDERLYSDSGYGHILGKGGAWRLIFFGETTALALEIYRSQRRGERGGVFFRGVGSRNNGGPLNPDAMRQSLKRLAKKAGVQLHLNSPAHSFRHTFAHQALDRLDCMIVQQLLGHKDVRTTMIYTQQHPKKLQSYHQRLSGWWE